MIAKKIKAYFEKRREQKRISEQFALEKKCVEYFDKQVPRWTGSLEELIGSTPLPEKGIYLLGKFKNDSFSLQAVRLHRSWGNERLMLSYGDYFGFLLKIIHVQHVPRCFYASITLDITRWSSMQIKRG